MFGQDVPWGKSRSLESSEEATAVVQVGDEGRSGGGGRQSDDRCILKSL